MALNDQILEYLQTYGPSTSKELQEFTGADKDVVAKQLHRMKHGTPQRKRCIHITSWVKEPNAKGIPYLQPVWAAGAKPNAKRDSYKTNERTVRNKYWEKRLVMSSVFTMGMSAEAVMKARKHASG